MVTEFKKGHYYGHTQNGKVIVRVREDAERGAVVPVDVIVGDLKYGHATGAYYYHWCSQSPDEQSFEIEVVEKKEEGVIEIETPDPIGI